MRPPIRYFFILFLTVVLSYGQGEQEHEFFDVVFFYIDKDRDGYGNKNGPYLKEESDKQLIVRDGKHFVSNNEDCYDNNPYLHLSTMFYRDSDGDGYGDQGQGEKLDCDFNLPTDTNGFPLFYSINKDDCNDQDTLVHPETVWYLDADEDGTGGETTFRGCAPPSNHVLTTGDECDDDATTTVKFTWYLDEDEDGFAGVKTLLACSAPINYYATSDDCDDTNPFLNPDTVWYLDHDGDGFGGQTTAQNCTQPEGYVSKNGDLDDNAVCIVDFAPQTYYLDSDGDGFGSPNRSEYCSSPSQGYVTNAFDCNDSNSAINPNTIWYLDADGDGFGSLANSFKGCTRSSGYINNHSDIDDSNPLITNIAPKYFYQDKDMDGYGNPSVFVYASNIPPDHVTNSHDCNDNNNLEHNFTVWFLDADGDGVGYNEQKQQTNQSKIDGFSGNLSLPTPSVSNENKTFTGCNPPQGLYVLNNNDHDDRYSSINGTPPLFYYVDNDGDSFGVSGDAILSSQNVEGHAVDLEDCDDNKAELNPNTVWYQDLDKDGFGSSVSVKQCEPPEGYVNNNHDYDDTTDDITDIQPRFFYLDRDEDSYGDPNNSLYSSFIPTGYVTNNLDCDDTNALVNPQNRWYEDVDGDGYGSDNSLNQCTQPDGYVSNSDDFDDNNVNIINIKPRNFYEDKDGDLYGNPLVYLFYSVKPDTYVTNDLDCNDRDARVNPQKIWYEDLDGDGLGSNITKTACLQPENYVENNEDISDDSEYITNIAPRVFYKDEDNDGYGDPDNTGLYSIAPPGYGIDNQDCNDADASINPDTVWYQDADGDGYGSTVNFNGCQPPDAYVRNNTDLDDDNRYITDVPGRYFYIDADGDGYGNPATEFFSSFPIDGYILDGTDCNDSSAQLHPYTQWYNDLDGDGFGDQTPQYQGCTPPSRQVQNHNDYDDSTTLITNIPPQYFYIDNDGDLYGNPQSSTYQSNRPKGYVVNRLDCNDNNRLIHPQTYWFKDNDQDGFGDHEDSLQACVPPSNYELNDHDLDDSTNLITDIPPVNFYRDVDEDGYGNDNVLTLASSIPNGFVSRKGDCDDNNALLNPETVWYHDFDQDGYGSKLAFESCIAPAGHVSNQDDFNDREKLITDIQPSYFYRDFDQDGYGDPEEEVYYSSIPEGYVNNSEDCDDHDNYIQPFTHWYPDFDGDGAGSPLDLVVQCEAPDGYVNNANDCDDTNEYRLGGLLDYSNSDDFNFDENAIYSDCSVPDPALDEPPFDYGSEYEGDGRVYADRDNDGLGDLDESYDLEETVGLHFTWVANNEDACPEVKGLKIFKGCLKPIIIKTILSPGGNQLVRLFEKDTLIVEKQKIIEDYLFFTDEVIYDPIVYNNPTKGMVNFRWEVADVSDFVNFVLVMGYKNAIQFEIPFGTDPSEVHIDLTDEPNDLYFIQLFFKDGRRLTRKIIKE